MTEGKKKIIIKIKGGGGNENEEKWHCLGSSDLGDYSTDKNVSLTYM